MSNEQLSQHVTEERMHEWLDNELTRRSSTDVSVHVQHCHECTELLETCRDMRVSVSKLLRSYDAELSAVPRVARADRARLAANSRAPSAPIINHIVVFSKPAQFWPTARRLTSLAALALVFVGTASMVLTRSYHSVAGSVSSAFARPGSVAASAGGESFSVSGFLRSIFTSNFAGSRVDVTGLVTSEAHRAMSGVKVSVRGTEMTAVTDLSGHFRFHGLPISVTSLVVTGPLGYETRVQDVNLYEPSQRLVNITLRAGVLKLHPFVVTSEQPAFDTPVQSKESICLTVFQPIGATDARMFQGLRGRIRAEGDFALDLIDWPAAGKTTRAQFVTESGNTLLGQAQVGSAQIRLTLTRDGSEWRGSATETRNGNSSWRRIQLREAGCSI